MLWDDFIKSISKRRDIENFLKWPEILQTMYPTLGNYYRDELNYLARHQFADSFFNVIKENKIGNPILLDPERITSMNAIHQTYHIAKFMTFSKKQLRDYDIIFEFGGGYGRICKVCCDLGFNGNYIIYDFPEMHRLQRHYLGGSNINSVMYCHKENLSGINIEKFKDKKVLFISTWALSEAPLNVRYGMHGIFKATDSFLFAFQKEFEGIRNLNYFNFLGDYSFNSLKTDSEEIDHLKGNYYYFGDKK